METPRIRERITCSIALLEDGSSFATISVTEGGVELHGWHRWHRSAEGNTYDSARAVAELLISWADSGVFGIQCDAELYGYVGG